MGKKKQRLSWKPIIFNGETDGYSENDIPEDYLVEVYDDSMSVMSETSSSTTQTITELEDGFLKIVSKHQDVILKKGYLDQVQKRQQQHKLSKSGNSSSDSSRQLNNSPGCSSIQNCLYNARIEQPPPYNSQVSSDNSYIYLYRSDGYSSDQTPLTPDSWNSSVPPGTPMTPMYYQPPFSYAVPPPSLPNCGNYTPNTVYHDPPVPKMLPRLIQPTPVVYFSVPNQEANGAVSSNTLDTIANSSSNSSGQTVPINSTTQVLPAQSGMSDHSSSLQKVLPQPVSQSTNNPMIQQQASVQYASHSANENVSSVCQHLLSQNHEVDQNQSSQVQSCRNQTSYPENSYPYNIVPSAASFVTISHSSTNRPPPPVYSHSYVPNLSQPIISEGIALPPCFNNHTRLIQPTPPVYYNQCPPPFFTECKSDENQGSSQMEEQTSSNEEMTSVVAVMASPKKSEQSDLGTVLLPSKLVNEAVKHGLIELVPNEEFEVESTDKKDNFIYIHNSEVYNENNKENKNAENPDLNIQCSKSPCSSMGTSGCSTPTTPPSDLIKKRVQRRKKKRSPKDRRDSINAEERKTDEDSGYMNGDSDSSAALESPVKKVLESEESPDSTINIPCKNELAKNSSHEDSNTSDVFLESITKASKLSISCSCRKNNCKCEKKFRAEKLVEEEEVLSVEELDEVIKLTCEAIDSPSGSLHNINITDEMIESIQNPHKSIDCVDKKKTEKNAIISQESTTLIEESKKENCSINVPHKQKNQLHEKNNLKDQCVIKNVLSSIKEVSNKSLVSDSCVANVDISELKHSNEKSFRNKLPKAVLPEGQSFEGNKLCDMSLKEKEINEQINELSLQTLLEGPKVEKWEFAVTGSKRSRKRNKQKKTKFVIVGDDSINEDNDESCTDVLNKNAGTEESLNEQVSSRPASPHQENLTEDQHIDVEEIVTEDSLDEVLPDEPKEEPVSLILPSGAVQILNIEDLFKKFDLSDIVFNQKAFNDDELTNTNFNDADIKKVEFDPLFAVNSLGMGLNKGPLASTRPKHTMSHLSSDFMSDKDKSPLLANYLSLKKPLPLKLQANKLLLNM